MMINSGSNNDNVSIWRNPWILFCIIMIVVILVGLYYGKSIINYFVNDIGSSNKV